MPRGTTFAAVMSLTVTSLMQGPALAHHSITGEFDTSITFDIKGTLTRLDWSNPHLWYYMDVINEAGAIEKWQCTTGTNPNRLIRSGWKKEDLPIGSIVHFARANPARDQSNTCFVGNPTLDDGTQVFRGNRNADD